MIKLKIKNLKLKILRRVPARQNLAGGRILRPFGVIGQDLRFNKQFSIFNFKSLMSEGLTLIEVMIVVAILALMSSTIFSVFQGSLLSHRRGTNRALICSEARAALDMMSREIEKAIVDERENIHYEVWDVSDSCTYRTYSVADEFYFIAPVNADNNDDDHRDLSEVGYWLKGDGSDTTLMRHYTSGSTNFVFYGGGNGNSDALIGNVSDLQFEYWDDVTSQFIGTTISAVPQIYALPKAVKITLVMEYEPEKEQIRHDTFITVVDIPGSGQ